MNNYSFEDINVGQTVSFDQEVTQDVVDAFAALSGDCNPLHLDEAYAGGTKYGRCIAHGMLLGCYLSRLVGTLLPGKRCLLMSQTIDFVAPVYPPALLHVVGRVLKKVEFGRAVVIQVTFSIAGETVAKGRAMAGVQQII